MSEGQGTREIKEKKLVGLGGWLAFVQVGMVLALLITIVLLQTELNEGGLLKAASYALMLAAIIMSIVQFYRYRPSFRIFLLCYLSLLIIYYYTLSDNARQSISEHLISAVGFILILLPIIALFFSRRVKNTFCEEGRQKISKLKKQYPLVGIEGWLVLFQLHMVILFFRPFEEILTILEGEAYATIWTINGITTSLLIFACVIQFYRRKVSFRLIYILAAVLINVETLAKRVDIYSAGSNGLYELVSIAIYGLIIAALFKSERVKNTFR